MGNAAFAVQYSIFVQYQLVRCPKTLIFLMFQKVSLSNPYLFKGPVFKPCLQTLKPGKWGTVIVKDMSRLGRNYLQVGFYTEMLFPPKGRAVYRCQRQCGQRKRWQWTTILPLCEICSTNGVVRDTSKKIKAVKRAKGMSGKPVTSKPVYGYLMDEDENYIVDEETAPVVQHIYQLCLAGNGPDQDCPNAYGAANPHAGDAGIPQDGQHPPLPPRL